MEFEGRQIRVAIVGGGCVGKVTYKLFKLILKPENNV